MATPPQVLKPVIRQLEQKVQKGVLAIRSPLNLAADVGLRGNLLELLGCYKVHATVDACFGDVCDASARHTICCARATHSAHHARCRESPYVRPGKIWPRRRTRQRARQATASSRLPNS